MVVTQGLKSEIISTVHDHYDAKFQYLAVGTGNSEPTPDQTALDNEVYRKARQEVTRDDASGSFTVSLWLNSTEANGNELKEVGVFDQESDGTMYARETFTPINKTEDMEIWIDMEFETDVQLNT